MSFGGVCALACVVLLLEWQQVAGQAPSTVSDKKNFYAGPGVLPKQILEARGFRAEDHNIITKDKYQIRLTRALNPLINKGRRGLRKRVPIIFTHGILESFNVFIVNSFNAEPKNFSNCTLADVSLREARRRLAREPSAKSLPLLALNYGHEVWLMSRRGFPGSQRQVGNPVQGMNGSPGLKPVVGPVTGFWGGITNYGELPGQVSFSVNKKFWNFTLDEQARYDLPEAIDYVLEISGQKQVSVVGHSAGGALTLMSLSLFPELSKKISSAILWSEAFSLGRKDAFAQLVKSKPLLERFIGAVPPTYATDQLQALYILLCHSKLSQETDCESVADKILGPSFGQAPLKPEFVNSLLYSSSSHELAQMLQNVERGGQMHKYDHGRKGNLALYGRPEPPAYNLSRITLDRLSFYEAPTDFLVSVADVEATRKLLRVPARRHLIKGPFNHQGYFFHRDNARRAVIPSLREIHLFSERKVRADRRPVAKRKSG